MRYFGTLNQKSQLTITKEIRKKLGIGPNSRVEMVVKDERIEVHPMPKSDFLSLKGFIKAPKEKDWKKARDAFENNYSRV